MKNKTLREPPVNLVLRRTAIQTFPGGQKVALYFCDQLKKYFSLNYGKSGIEIMESDFSVIEKLKTIEDIEPLYFHDGSSLNIDKECSEHILETYNLLSEGKSEFEEYIMQSETNFLKILKYSVDKFKKET
jgi:hypothetical protein